MNNMRISANLPNFVHVCSKQTWHMTLPTYLVSGSTNTKQSTMYLRIPKLDLREADLCKET